MKNLFRYASVLAALMMPLTACGDQASNTGSTGVSKAASSQSTPSGAPTNRSGTSSPKGGGKTAAAGGADASSPTSIPKTSAVHISIPSIGLNHSIVGGGLSGGVLSPPAGSIVQFTGYNRVIPGQNGIAVLAGHVTYNGPDVFYALHNAAPGAPMTITYADGSTRKFLVTAKASINKDALQNDPRVWGSSSTPVVALVTCDANSGWANAQHHLNNFVVWARPA